MFTIPFLLPRFAPYIYIRERYEQHVRPTFGSASKDADVFYSRFRAGNVFNFGHGLSGQAEYQYTKKYTFQTGMNNGRTIDSNMSIGMLEYRPAQFDAIIGRQRMFLGDQRLISSSDWTNTNRSFDGIRFKSHGFDFYALGVGVAQAPKPHNAHFVGLSHSSKLGLTSLIYNHSITKPSSSATTDDLTLDEIYGARVGNWALNLDAAGQTGTRSSKHLLAAASHLDIDFYPTKGLRLYAEGNYATGGVNGSTDHRFDTLYPSNHDKYGLMDTVVWENMKEIGLGAEFSLNGQLSVKASLDQFFPADRNDSWYKSDGSALIATSAGANGRFFGREADLSGQWTPGRGYKFSAGFGLFEPGSWAKATGHGSNQVFSYFSFEGTW